VRPLAAEFVPWIAIVEQDQMHDACAMHPVSLVIMQCAPKLLLHQQMAEPLGPLGTVGVFLVQLASRTLSVGDLRQVECGPAAGGSGAYHIRRTRRQLEVMASGREENLIVYKPKR